MYSFLDKGRVQSTQETRTPTSNISSPFPRNLYFDNMAKARPPEEIICEIISLCLPFSERTFLKFPEDGRPHWQQERRDTHEEPSTNILLLSKRGLRIGTPILYKGVCVRETGCRAASEE